MNMVFLGLPGAGKRTQAKLFSQNLGINHISMGDILLDEIARKTPLGMEVRDYTSTGRLAPDWLILRILKDRLAGQKRGSLFDGFPRTLEQAEALDSWLSANSSALQAVIYFNISEAETARRLAARAVCPSCGAVYSLPGTVLPACGACAKPLCRREDDKPEIVKKRVMAYRDQTEPILSYYRSNDILLEVKAEQPQQAVTTQIALLLKSVI